MRAQAMQGRRGPTAKQVRFDPAPGSGEASARPAPARGLTGAIEKFREWLRSSPRNRRQSARHEAGGFEVWLGWWRSDDDFFAVPAELVNLSRGGALVQFRAAPPDHQDIWVCLDARDARDCVSGSMIDLRPIRAGYWAARLEFRTPCPHRFFDAAVCSTGESPASEPV